MSETARKEDNDLHFLQLAATEERALLVSRAEHSTYFRLCGRSQQSVCRSAEKASEQTAVCRSAARKVVSYTIGLTILHNTQFFHYLIH